MGGVDGHAAAGADGSGTDGAQENVGHAREGAAGTGVRAGTCGSRAETGGGMVPRRPGPRGMRILLVAAEAREFEGVLARASGNTPVSAGADWTRSCRIGDSEAL